MRFNKANKIYKKLIDLKITLFQNKLECGVKSKQVLARPVSIMNQFQLEQFPALLMVEENPKGVDRTSPLFMSTFFNY